MAEFFESEDLWDGQAIPIICATGEKGVGKTLFGLNIDPYNPATGKSKFGGRTIVFDFEGSSRPHKKLIAPDCYFNMTKIAVREFGMDYTPLQLFNLFKDLFNKETKDGGVSVAMIDPVSELESGIIQWVEQNPASCGYTANQFSKSTALKMGAVKAYQKKLFDSFSNMVGCLYIVAHMRNQFSGGSATGRREAKGKETNYELASLFLKFERDVIKKGPNKGSRPEKPAAVVMKSRLNHTQFNETTGNNDIIPVLPPRVPVATPQTIRDYIVKPADFSKLSDDEKIILETLSEDERLLLQDRIAANQKDAAEAELAREANKRSRSSEKQYATAPQGADDHNSQVAEKAKMAGKPATETQAENIMQYASWFQENGIENGKAHVKSIGEQNECWPPTTFGVAAKLIELLIDHKEEHLKSLSSVAKGNEPETVVYAEVAEIDLMISEYKKAEADRFLTNFLKVKGVQKSAFPVALLDQINSVAGIIPEFIRLSKATGWKVKDAIEASGGKHPLECEPSWLQSKIKFMSETIDSHKGTESPTLMMAEDDIPF